MDSKSIAVGEGYIQDFTDNADLIPDVFLGELIIGYESIVEAIYVVLIGDYFDKPRLTFRDKLCLFCFAVLLVAGLGIDVGIGLNGEPDQPPA